MTGDPFGPVYRMLDELQMKHFEMAGQVAEYKQLVEDLEERADEDRLRMARNLPGARYLVNTTFVREHWLKVGAELQRLFPEDRDGAGDN
jgi:hypothetical protein